MTDLIQIAGLGGRKSLIDTAEEVSNALRLLNENISELDKRIKKDKENPGLEKLRDGLQGAIETLTHHKGMAFQINFGPPNFENCHFCTPQSRDCYMLLIPVDKNFAVFPIYSGAMFRDFVDYVPVSDERWKKVISPLEKPAKTPNEERSLIAKAVDNFQTLVASDKDWGGWLGNLIPVRWEQDCVEETRSLAPFLFMLSAEGYLKFHKFEIGTAADGIPLFHYTAAIMGNNGEAYSVDPWLGRTDIMSLKTWKWAYEQQRKEMWGPKY